MPKKKVTPKPLTAKEIEHQNMFRLKDCLRTHVPYPPSRRLFKVGDLVRYGSHPNTEILEVHDNGRVYKIRTWGEYKEYHNLVYRDETNYVTWNHVDPIIDQVSHNLINNTDIELNYSNMMVDSVISTYYNFGIDMNPVYQREHVWSVEDKVELIDSIFNNRSIGSYILCHNGYGEGYGYEVLDGKQRIQALIDFVEDKFTYKGLLFSELNRMEVHHFENFNFPRAEIRNSNLEQKIRTFIHVNTTGKHMSPEHIKKVKEILLCG